MVVVLTNKAMSYLVVDLFDDLVGPAFVLIFIMFSSLTALFSLIQS